MADIYRKYDSKTNEWADFGDLKARQDLGFVEDTDVATHTIAAGQYVIWKGNLYTANSDITSGDTLSSSNLTAVGDKGGLNKLNSSISAIDSSLAIVADGDTHIALTTGQYIYVKNHNTLAEGLYTANSSIGQNVALTTSNVTTVGSKGGLNKLNENTINNVSDGFSTTSYSYLQSKLTSLANNMVNGESKLVRFYIDFDSSVFARGATCFGNLNIISKGTSYLYFSCLVSDNICNVICITYNNGTWLCKKLASEN